MIQDAIILTLVIVASVCGIYYSIKLRFMNTTNHSQVWQLCPKCGGQGTVSKPPGLSGNIHEWGSSSVSSYQCDVCEGKKIISAINGLPPNWEGLIKI